jgi:hypothetical protein
MRQVRLNHANVLLATLFAATAIAAARTPAPMRFGRIEDEDMDHLQEFALKRAGFDVQAELARVDSSGNQLDEDALGRVPSFSTQFSNLDRRALTVRLSTSASSGLVKFLESRHMSKSLIGSHKTCSSGSEISCFIHTRVTFRRSAGRGPGGGSSAIPPYSRKAFSSATVIRSLQMAADQQMRRTPKASASRQAR